MSNNITAAAVKKQRARNKEADRAATKKRIERRKANPPIAPNEKTCCRCKQTKPASEFGRQIANPDGLNYACKECLRARDATRTDKIRANSKKWYRENRERRLAVGKAWVIANRERRLEQQKRYREANHDKVVAAIKACIQRNPKKYSERTAKWAREHPERRREIRAKYRHSHPKQIAIDNRNWRLRHPEAAKALSRVKRARKRNAEGKHTAQEIKRLMILQKYKCANCGASIRKEYHADHIMPLARGGSNWIENIQLLCPHCNLCKHDKDPIAWAQENGQLL